MVSALKQIRKEHPCYGVQSLLDELPDDLKVSYGKGYKICKEHGLLQKRRRPKGITKANPNEQASEDLIHRDFKADAPSTKWLTDITEMACKDGKLYLCGILDCYDGAIVGYAMDDNMKTPLCTTALNVAISRYGKTKNMILHSDRGSQFTSHLFRKTLEKQGIRQSMGRTGSCYDNARMESFFATMKKDLIYRLPLYKLTKAEVKYEIFLWIESYYNQRRRYTANEGKQPPLVKRVRYTADKKTA